MTFVKFQVWLDPNEINEIDDQDELADEIDRFIQVGDEEELDSEDLDPSAMPTSSYVGKEYEFEEEELEPTAYNSNTQIYISYLIPF